ncbi:ABC transporter ATP-binding protein [Flavobacteriaceae bacterium M23B6Z8]
MLSLENISFRYNTEEVLTDINVKIPQGSHVSVIGASGCGKSTLLKLIYGLYTPLTGSIKRNGVTLLGPDFNLIPGEDFMKYLAQDFDLMPYITVQENVGKYLSNFYPEEKRKRSLELLETVEMTEFANVKAQFLSGGQQQRIALARALAREPEIILLDEPFSHIDNFRKNSLRRKLFSYLKEKNITCIVATHDSTDALSFADQLMVLQDGKNTAQGIPETLYKNPPSFYVASLFGDVNFLNAAIFSTDLPSVRVCIYPHELILDKNGPIEVKVFGVYFKGDRWRIEGRFQEDRIFFDHVKPLEKNSFYRLSAAHGILKNRVEQLVGGMS